MRWEVEQDEGGRWYGYLVGEDGLSVSQLSAWFNTEQELREFLQQKVVGAQVAE